MASADRNVEASEISFLHVPSHLIFTGGSEGAFHRRGTLFFEIECQLLLWQALSRQALKTLVLLAGLLN